MSTIDPRYSDMAPNVTQTVYAGDELIMRDNDGNEFSVIAKEAEATMDFIKAFDMWFTAREKGITRADFVDALWLKVKRTFNDLPIAVQRELPSMKSGAVLLNPSND